MSVNPSSPPLVKGRGRSKTVSSSTEMKFSQRESVTTSPHDESGSATPLSNIDSTAQLSTLSPNNILSQPESNRQKEKQLIRDLSNDTASKVAAYLKGELSLTTRDLNLLSEFNYQTIEQYQELSHTAQELLASSSKMQQAYSNLIPYINYVDQVCQQIEYLEVIASELDEYSLNLEEKIKLIKKRKEMKKSNNTNNSNMHSFMKR